MYNFCYALSDGGVQRIAGVLKAQGWRREAGDFTVFPTASSFEQFKECLPHLQRRFEGEGSASG
jgi:hypothetical protein